MAESQPTIMINVIMYLEKVDHLRCGEMEGLICVIVPGHLKEHDMSRLFNIN